MRNIFLFFHGRKSCLGLKRLFKEEEKEAKDYLQDSNLDLQIWAQIYDGKK